MERILSPKDRFIVINGKQYRYYVKKGLINDEYRTSNSANNEPNRQNTSGDN